MQPAKFGLAVFAAVAALNLAGCGEQKKPEPVVAAPPPPPPPMVVKLGHVGPLTGGIAHLGKDNENGARLAIDEANEAKAQLGGQPVKFTLVAEDDQADPKVGTTVAQKLVGPSYKDVAAKYRGDAGAETKLVDKVKKGSQGTWGQVPMPPNSNVPDADVRALVKWILSQK